MPTYESRYFQIKVAVAERIESLGLQAPNGDALNIVIMKLATDRLPPESQLDADFVIGEVAFPMVQVSQVNAETITQNDGTDTRIAIGYPVQVTIVAQDNQDLFTNDDLYSSWREALITAFAGQPLPGVDQIWYTSIEPMSMVNTDAFFNKDTYTSAMVFRFHERRQVNSVVPDPIAIPL